MISILFFFGCDSEGADSEIVSDDAEIEFLVFSKTDGWRHDSIEEGQTAFMEIAQNNGYSITLSEDSELFTTENLSQYDAVVFLNTTLNLFNDTQREAFENYIRSGGGFVGVHSATDTEYDWPWYGDLVGAYFDNHPGNPNVREAEVLTRNSEHQATNMLPEVWVRSDEWYNFGYINDEINVLLELNTDSYEGSDHAGDHPISWYHEYDGGRAFYTGLGHTKESYSDELFLQHLQGGLNYAMGVQ